MYRIKKILLLLILGFSIAHVNAQFYYKTKITNEVTVDDDGLIKSVNTSDGDNIFLFHKYISSNERQAVLLKLSSLGAIEWGKKYEYAYSDYAEVHDILTDSVDNIYLQADNYIIKLDPEGELIWRTCVDFMGRTLKPLLLNQQKHLVFVVRNWPWHGLMSNLALVELNPDGEVVKQQAFLLNEGNSNIPIISSVMISQSENYEYYLYAKSPAFSNAIMKVDKDMQPLWCKRLNPSESINSIIIKKVLDNGQYGMVLLGNYYESDKNPQKSFISFIAPDGQISATYSYTRPEVTYPDQELSSGTKLGKRFVVSMVDYDGGFLLSFNSQGEILDAYESNTHDANLHTSDKFPGIIVSGESWYNDMAFTKLDANGYNGCEKIPVELSRNDLNLFTLVDDLNFSAYDTTYEQIYYDNLNAHTYYKSDTAMTCIMCLKPVCNFEANTEDLTVSLANLSANYDSCYWDFGDGTTSEELNPIHTYETSGEYTIKLSCTNFCGISFLEQTIVAGSVGDHEFHAEPFTIIPNPANDKIQLTFKQPIDKPVEVNIYQLNGALATHTQVAGNNSTIDIRHLKPGLYFIETRINGTTGRKKLVVY